MKRIHSLLALTLLAACAHLGGGSDAEARLETWNLAQQALAANDFERATALFRRIVDEHPGTEESRESLFYLGAMRLDPRNPAWDPRPAEELLGQYLAIDTVPPARIFTRPEARTLFELARQLNMPPEQRVAGLQPERVVVEEPRRVVVPARETRALAAEVERLRQAVAQRDATIEEQRAELERIRKTLTGRRDRG